MTAFIVLAKEAVVPMGVVIELRDMGAIRYDLSVLAQVAQKEGFDMMYEFDSSPDMAEVGRLAPLGKVSGMSSMSRLWVLREDKL